MNKAAHKLDQWERFALHACLAFPHTRDGHSRYGMACAEADANGKPAPTVAEYEAAQDRLFARGLITRDGVVTYDGS